MKQKYNLLITGVILLALLIGLPLIGVCLAGKSVGTYAEFPPLTRYVEHAGFSWPVFVLLAAFILAVILPFLVRLFGSVHGYGVQAVNHHPSTIIHQPLTITHYPFPSWGWLGLGAGICAWMLAWNRFPWFAPFQHFTFSPLWFSYIVVINALKKWRTGSCMMTDRPRYFLALFPVSALFWWFFEYLNRFVQNWYYSGVIDLTSQEYVIFATLPFSTVLPAVLGTYELLESFPRLSLGLDDFIRIDVKQPKIIAWVVLAISCAGLAGIGVWPDYLFPLLWVSPLFVISSLQAIQGQDTVFSGMKTGNWRRIFLLALAALICGFFWEMWNYKSLAKWIYAVPFVNRFHLFEMPALGYAGYLPFGLECGMIADAILRICGEERRKEVAMNTEQPDTKSGVGRLTYICKLANLAILGFGAVYYLILPGFILIHDLMDPNIRGPGIPQVAWRVHRQLTPRYEKWARQRIASGRAGHLNLYDVPSTEWPMFGSVFYLAATENLQAEWEKNHSLSSQPPREYARKTIEAATDLVLDPVHHTWVKTHWGEDYMHTENVFFRAMIIQALTSRENLLGDGKHLDILRDQVETLAADLDKSPFGVLNDYPWECYPIDVFAAVACIRRADKVLGTDHKAFADRAIRAFSGEMLDERGLIPYMVEPENGQHDVPSRGIGNSYVLIYAPELYPEVAKEWYELYERHFWQERMFAAGFREYPKDMPGRDWFFDVDSGPVINGYSPAGNAYAVAACKVNGRFDHAYMITAQVLAACWPLPDGSLLGTRILSNPQHAPYLGEANMLFLLTRQPAPDVEIRTGGHLPGMVYVAFLFYFGIGAAIILGIVRGIRRWKCRGNLLIVPAERFQFSLWAGLIVAGAVLLFSGHPSMGVISILLAQFLPRTRKDGAQPAAPSVEVTAIRH